MATPLEIFRVVAAEFAAIADNTVEFWIELTRPLVSKKYFGRVYEQALALLTAHRMETAGVGATAPDAGSGGLEDIGCSGIALKVASYSSGGESISFNSGTLTTPLATDAEYAQTTYGVQYLTLRDLYAISIINSGEKSC
jgi:hypothetical protein